MQWLVPRRVNSSTMRALGAVHCQAMLRRDEKPHAPRRPGEEIWIVVSDQLRWPEARAKVVRVPHDKQSSCGQLANRRLRTYPLLPGNPHLAVWSNHDL